MEWFEREKLMRAMRCVRQQALPEPLPRWDPNAAEIYFEEYMLHGTPYTLPMVGLKTSPCSWLLSGGGCTMCGYHLAGAWRRPVSSRNLLNQVHHALQTLHPVSRFPLVHIGSAGSLLDSAEVPDDICFQLFRALQNEGVKAVITESRPEYLREAKLRAIREVFKGEIMVGIGLETASEDWRALCINKGLSTDTYIEAVEGLQQLGISFANHVFLGKPFLTPREDIEDAVAAIRFSFEVGSEFAILMVSHLHPNTLTYWLYERHLYELPKLWAPLQVLSMLEPATRSRVVIKGVDKMSPEPIAFASNCSRCTDEVCRLIEMWNQTRDYAFVEAALNSCDCREAWLRELNRTGEGDRWRRTLYETVISELLA